MNNNFSKVADNTYSLYQKYKVKIHESINWFSPFPGYNNKFPKELSSLESFSPQEYTNIIDNINLIIKSNDIKKRRVTVYLALSIIVAILCFFLLFGPWYLYLISMIIISTFIIFFSIKFYYSNSKFEKEIKEKIKEFNQKYFNQCGIRIVFKPKLRKASKTYQYKLTIFYPFSYQQLQLIRLYNQYHQQNDPSSFDPSSSSPSNQLPIPSTSSFSSSTYSSANSSFFNNLNNLNNNNNNNNNINTNNNNYYDNDLKNSMYNNHSNNNNSFLESNNNNGSVNDNSNNDTFIV